MGVFRNSIIRTSGTGLKRREESDDGVFIKGDPDMLADMMKRGIVHFQYRKKPKKGKTIGEIRDAWGTKLMTTIEVVSKTPGGGDCPPKNAGYTVYFDMEKNDWRAFHDLALTTMYTHVYTLDEYNTLSDEEMQMSCPEEIK